MDNRNTGAKLTKTTRFFCFSVMNLTKIQFNVSGHSTVYKLYIVQSTRKKKQFRIDFQLYIIKIARKF